MSRLQHGDTVIIIGSGVIGLCTAYNLAKNSLTSSSSNIKIKVIEARGNQFSAASSHCTGCFHYERLPEPVVPLGKYSFGLWEAETTDAFFKATTGYRARSSFGISHGNGHHLDQLPDWVCKEAAWDVDSSVLGAYTATVNPTGVGEWLTSRCHEMGVDIITGLSVVGASLSAANKVQTVTCWQEQSQTTLDMDCKQILLACGPWTPTVYETLFPSSSVRLHWTTDAGDWISCKNPCSTTEASTAFVSFADLVDEKMEFAARNDGSIWACGTRNFTADLPSPCQVAQPDEEIINVLEERARKWLNWSCHCVEKHHHQFQLLSKGRDFRPATPTGLPIISEVPSSVLNNTSEGADGKGSSASGIFVCWGHGSYGLTLGMGSGRLISQLMLGKQTDIDLRPFLLDRTSSNDEYSNGTGQPYSMNPVAH